LISLLKIVSLLLLSIDAEVSTLDGGRFAGSLNSIDQQQIVLDGKDDKPLVVQLADALELRLTASDPSQNSSDLLKLVLSDSSLIPVAEITGDATEVRSKSELLGELKIPRTVVRAVLLQPMKPDWTLQWDAFLERSNEKDMLIVEKRDGLGLDFLAGVVSSIAEREVPFLLDGNEIPVPRPRVVGIVFGTIDGAGKHVSSGLSVKLRDGSVLRGNSVTMIDATIEIEAAWGQRLQIPINSIASVDFSSGRLHYLSNLEPISEQYLGLDPPGKEWGPLFEEDRLTRDGLSSQWRMSRDRFPNSGRPPLTLRGQRFEKGLCIFPSAKIEYALDGQYSRLNAVVGVDDDVAFNQQKGEPDTVVELKIAADGEQIFKRLIGAREEPVLLDLKLTGVNTLSIIVDFGDGSSMCDYLDIADARLVVDTSKK